MVKVRVRFPVMEPRNYKAIRESILLDSYGEGYEEAIVAAAEASKSPEHEVFVNRSYSPAGRFSVWIVDQRETGESEEERAATGTRMQRRKALQQVLAKIPGALL